MWLVALLLLLIAVFAPQVMASQSEILGSLSIVFGGLGTTGDVRLRSKKFRIALEGASIDGREITGEQIQQMANNYDPIDKYGARIWLEHYRGLFADSPFCAYGDVAALSAQKEKSGQWGLYAELEPTKQLIAINQERQKIYTSIEIEPSFADTGEAYLMGLGITDSPASTGTEALQFNIKRRKAEGNLFSVAEEIEHMQFEEFTDQSDDTQSGPNMLDKVKQIFSRHKTNNDAAFRDASAAVEQIAEHQVALENSVNEKFSKAALGTSFNELKTAHEELLTKFNELQASLDKAPHKKFTQRPAATGGEGKNETDC